MDALNAGSNRRRASSRLAIAAFIVLVPAAVHAIWDQVEANRVRRYVEGLRAGGEPVDLREEQRPVVNPQAREASRLYLAAAILSGDAFTNPQRAGSAAQARRELVRLEQDLAASGVTPVDAASLVKLREITDRSEPALLLLDRAAPLPFERMEPHEYSYLEGDLARLAHLNALRADLASFTGDGDAAAAALLAGMRLRRAMGAFSRGVAGGMPGSLQLMLARTAPSDPRLDALQQAYSDQSTDDGLARDLELRRARIIGAVWPTTSRSHFAQRIGPAERTGGSSLGFTLLRPWLTHQFLRSMHGLDASVATMREPWPQKLEDAGPLPPRPPVQQAPSFAERVMTWGRVPYWPPAFRGALAPTVVNGGRTLAQLRVGVAVLAVERWRRAHGGAPPENLQALVPQLLAAVPQDPFTGGPVRFVRRADGYTVYSAGRDRQDNGGDIGAWTPDLQGINIWQVQRGDIGITVPLRPVSGAR